LGDATNVRIAPPDAGISTYSLVTIIQHPLALRDTSPELIDLPRPKVSAGPMPADVALFWGTTPEERALRFPGDLPENAQDDLLWRGVDVDAPAGRVFRWLCQLRSAPYSYDWIDNLGRRSPQALTPGLEHLERGQTFMQIFRLEDFAPGAYVTLVTPVGSRGARLFGVVRATYWARPISPNRTRLLVKLRVTSAPGLCGRAMRPLLPWGDLIMMRRQLLNLKRLAEREGLAVGRRTERS
jgi:hypothetical protein